MQSSSIPSSMSPSSGGGAVLLGPAGGHALHAAYAPGPAYPPGSAAAAVAAAAAQLDSVSEVRKFHMASLSGNIKNIQFYSQFSLLPPNRSPPAWRIGQVRVANYWGDLGEKRFILD
jgi:hypothetical protein